MWLIVVNSGAMRRIKPVSNDLRDYIANILEPQPESAVQRRVKAISRQQLADTLDTTPNSLKTGSLEGDLYIYVLREKAKAP